MGKSRYEHEGKSLDTETLPTLYRTMVTIRAFELKIKELVQLNLVGGAAHLSIGQEAVAAGVYGTLRKSDQILSTHRGHGHAIVKWLVKEGDTVRRGDTIMEVDEIPASISVKNMYRDENLSSRLKASPRAEKLAQYLGIYISGVTGSGPKNRITSRDVQNFYDRSSGEHKI